MTDEELERLRARVDTLETALRLVRDLMHDLPAHDNVTLVAVRLRKHFDNLAGEVIADALATAPPAEAEGDAQ